MELLILQQNPAALFFFVLTIGASLYVLYGNQDLMRKYALSPYDLVNNKHFGMLLTSGFIHGSMQHLVFNMLSFYFFAFTLERILGSVHFIILYFAGLVLSDVYTVIKEKDNPDYCSLGASGAISAVLFSFIVFKPFSKIFIMFIPIGIPAIIFGPLYLVYCIYAARRQADHINHDAHFFGALTGIGMTVILRPDSVILFARQITAFFTTRF